MPLSNLPWKKVHDLRLVVVAVCVCVVLPELILTTHLARVERQTQLEQVQRDVTFVAKLLAVEEDRWFEETRQFLALLARTETILDPAKCRPFLNELRREYPQFSGISVTDIRGNSLCSATIPPIETRNVLKDDYFQNVMRTGEFSIGSFAIGRSSGLPRIRAAYPIKDVKEQITQVVVASMPLNRINAVAAIHLRPLFQRYTLTQVDESGDVLAHQPESGQWVIGNPAPELSFTKHSFAGDAVSFADYGVNKERFLYASAIVSSRPSSDKIRIILGVPEKVATESIDGRFWNTVLLMLGAFGFSLLLGLLTAHFYVVRPVSALESAANSLASGDYGARSDVAYGWAQLGNLARVMDKMAEKIQARAEEVRSAETKFRTIVESVPDGIVIIDPSGRIVLANIQIERLFGWDSSELVGQFVELLLPSRFHDRRARPRDTFYSIPAYRPKGQNLELYGLRRDGTEFPIEISTSPMETTEGMLVAASIRDITERKQASERLLHASEQLKEAQRISHVGSWEWDIATGMTEQSEEMLRILRLSPDERHLSFERFLQLVHPDDAGLLQNTVRATLATGQPWCLDFRLVHPDGTEKVLHSEAYVVCDETGRPLKLVGVDQDITERKHSEQRLRTTAERLRKLARHLHDIREEERSLISREIHDELGQSLSGLKMDLYSLGRKLPRNDAAIQNRIGNTMKHVEEIIRDVRRLSAELRPPMLDLGLATAIESLAEEFESRSNIQTKLRLPAQEINLDQYRCIALYRIIQEALTNISRHSGATLASIELRRDSEDLFLQVSDDGRGISESSLVASNALGITGMRERAILLGGELKVVASPQGGTIVSARIPLILNDSTGNNGTGSLKPTA